jgi:hypothetical protein
VAAILRGKNHIHDSYGQQKSMPRVAASQSLMKLRTFHLPQAAGSADKTVKQVKRAHRKKEAGIPGSLFLSFHASLTRTIPECSGFLP